MKIDLSATQIRILGCLIEKQLSTPEYYPLTLSALTNACNQKSNRDPVMKLAEYEVRDEIKKLLNQTLVREKHLPGARVAKYEHKLRDTLTKQFDFSTEELAVLAELFLRGPQTSGELRARCTRMHEFTSLDAVETVLSTLQENEAGPFVKPLPRQPGRREIRYCHLFGVTEPVQISTDFYEEIPPLSSESRDSELEILKEELAQLKADVEELKLAVQALKQD